MILPGISERNNAAFDKGVITGMGFESLFISRKTRAPKNMYEIKPRTSTKYSIQISIFLNTAILVVIKNN